MSQSVLNNNLFKYFVGNDFTLLIEDLFYPVRFFLNYRTKILTKFTFIFGLTKQRISMAKNFTIIIMQKNYATFHQNQ